MTGKIELRNSAGDVLFSYECENNTTGKTLERAVAENVKLHGLVLVNADLDNLDLSGMNALGSVFILCRMHNCTLRCSYLQQSRFINTAILDSDWSGTCLIGAVFHYSSLSNVNLSDTVTNHLYVIATPITQSTLKNIKGFDMIYGISALNAPGYGNIIDDSLYYPLTCPSDGAFTGWTKIYTDGDGSVDKPGTALVKLQIPEDAKRVSRAGCSRICCCDKAMVLDIIDLDSGEHLHTAEHNTMTRNTVYTVGEMLYPDSYDSDRWLVWADGIHVFINRQDALECCPL